MNKSNRGLALIVDDDKTNRMVLQALLTKNGFDIKTAEDGKQAISVFKENKIDIIFMDVMMPVMDGYQSTRIIKSLCEEQDNFIPVIFLTALTDDESLAKCIESGGDDFISKPYNMSVLNSKIKAMERVRDLSRKISSMYARLRNDEELAEKVFSNAVLAENIQNAEIKSIIKSADIFSGDMFISAYSPSRDINILLGDFTGHGLAAALGALPVSEVFHAMTPKGYSLNDILKTINKKLYDLLPVEMFMACQIISINHELKHISVCNCGMPPIYIKTDNEVVAVKSTCIPLGISNNIDYAQHIQYLETKMGDRIIVSSDGLTEARDDDDLEYGEDRLLNILNNSSMDEAFIIDLIDADQKAFCGQAHQHDDISIAEIRLQANLLPIWDIATISEEKATDIEIKSLSSDNLDCVEFSIHNHGQHINKLDPVPQIINNISQIISTTTHSQSLFTILTELYVNALDHGVLGLDSSLKDSAEGFSLYFENRAKALELLDDAYILINIKINSHPDKHVIIIRIEDSGVGFDISKLSLNAGENQIRAFGRGVLLVKNLCHSLHYELPGNIVEAVYVCEHDLEENIVPQ